MSRNEEESQQQHDEHLEFLNKFNDCNNDVELTKLLLEARAANLDLSTKFRIEKKKKEEKNKESEEKNGDGNDSENAREEEPYYGTLLHNTVLNGCDWKILLLGSEVEERREIRMEERNSNKIIEEEEKKRKQTTTATTEDGGKRSKKESTAAVTIEEETAKGKKRSNEESTATTATTAKIARKDDETTTEEISMMSLLLTTDSNGQTPLHLAVVLNRKDCLESLLGECETDQDRLALLTAIDNKGRNVLHLAAALEDAEKMRDALEGLTITTADLWNMIDKKDNNGDTPLMIAAKNKNEDVFLRLWKEMYRDREKKKQVVLGLDEDGKNMVDHCSDIANNNKVFSSTAIKAVRAYSECLNRSKELIDAVKALDYDRFHQILGECKSDELRIAMMVNQVEDAAQHQKTTAIQALIERHVVGKTHDSISTMLETMMGCGLDLLSSIIPFSSSSNDTSSPISFVRLAMRLNKVSLLRFFVSRLSTDEHKRFANRVDDKRRTLIHLAILEDTRDWDEDPSSWNHPGYCKLNPDDFDFVFEKFDLYTARDWKYGQNILQLAAERHSGFFKRILEKAPDRDTISGMMNDFDHKGRSILFYLSTAEQVKLLFSSRWNFNRRSFYIKYSTAKTTILHQGVTTALDLSFFSEFFHALNHFRDAEAWKRELLWAKDEKGLTAIDYAFEVKHFAIFSSVLQETCLMEDGKIAAIIRTRVDENGRGILHLVVASAKEQDCEAVIGALMIFDSNLAFCQDKQGKTALHVAAESRNYKAFKGIVDGFKAEEEKLKILWMEDVNGLSAVDLIVQSRDGNLLTYIFEADFLTKDGRIAELISTRVDGNGQTALHRAASEGNNSLIKRIITFDSKIAFIQDDNGQTALHIAAESQGKISTMAAIVHACRTEEEKRALILTRDNAGDTVIENANRRVDANVMSFFLQLQCLRQDNRIVEIIGTTMMDDHGQTILHHAVARGNRDAIRAIMSFDSNLAFIQDKQGKTALHIAVEASRFVDRGSFRSHVAKCCNGDAFCSLLCGCKSEEEKKKLLWMADTAGESAVEIAVRLFKAGVLHRVLQDKSFTEDGRVAEILRKSLDKKGRTILHRAIPKHIDLVKDILSLGVELCFVQDQDGRTPLHKACMLDDRHFLFAVQSIINSFESSEEVVRLILVQDNDGASILDYCIRSDSFKLFKYLADHSLLRKSKGFVKAMSTCVDEDGKTILHRAMSKEENVVVNLSLSPWRDMLFVQDKSGKTVLHEAAGGCRQDVCLDSFGATKELLWIVDHQEQTALHHALKNGNLGVFQLLFARHYGARKNDEIVHALRTTVDENGQNVLHRAIAMMDYNPTESILVFDSDLAFHQDKQGKTALHFAAAQSDKRLFERILVRCKTDKEGEKLLWMENHSGETAVHVAVRHGNIEAIVFVLEKQQLIRRANLVDILRTSVNENGQTLLHQAIAKQYQSASVTKLVVFDSSLVFIQDKQGKTPLHIAAALSEIGLFLSILNGCKSDEEKKRLMLMEDTNGETPIHAAARSADGGIFSLIIREECLSNNDRVKEILRTTTDESKQTILHRLAARKNRSDSVMALMMFDSRLAFIQDIEKQTALHVAAQKNGAAFCAILDGCKTDEEKEELIWMEDIDGRNVIEYAVQYKDLGVMYHLLQEQCLAKHNDKIAEILRREADAFERSILHRAVLADHLDLVKRIISLDSSLAFGKDFDWRTPLHLAVKCETSTLFEAILCGCKSDEEKKKLVWMADRRGYCVIDLAADSTKTWPISSLLAHECLMKDERIAKFIRGRVDRSKQTILHRAASAGDVEAINRIISLDSSLAFIQDENGETALHVAKKDSRIGLSSCALSILKAMKSDQERIKLLWMADKDGRTVIHNRVESIRRIEDIFDTECCLTKERVSEILRAVVDEKGQTILHRAALEGKNSVVESLMDNDSAILAMKDNEGYTALHRAVIKARESGHRFPTSFLLDKDGKPRMNIDPNIAIGLSRFF